MAKVTIEFTESDVAGEVTVTAHFDPPVMPGEEMPITHRTAMASLKGTKLEPILRACLLANAA